MQMDPRQLFIDARHQGVCPYCGNEPDTRDHVPPKVLLDEPYPPELPVVKACETCNNGSSLDEEYLACLIDVVLAGSIEPARIGRAKVRRILTENSALASRIMASQVRHDDGNLAWKAEVDRIRRIVVKLARGHAAYELYPRLNEPEYVMFAPIILMSDGEFDNFESGKRTGLWPEIGSRAFFRRYGKTPDRIEQSGQWIIVQTGRYRYAVEETTKLRVRIVLSEYLACEVTWSG